MKRALVILIVIVGLLVLGNWYYASKNNIKNHESDLGRTVEGMLVKEKR